MGDRAGIWTGSMNTGARIGGSVGLYDTTLRDGEQTVGVVLDPELVEQLRDLELLPRVEHDADRLLPVAQGRVVKADAAAEPVGVVHRSGPDLTRQQRTIPSGKAESFSSPSGVTRKLSSTRSPPPPGQ